MNLSEVPCSAAAKGHKNFNREGLSRRCLPITMQDCSLLDHYMLLKIERSGKAESFTSVVLILRLIFVVCVSVQVDTSGRAV